LTPTKTASLIDAASTILGIKKSVFTHKNFSIDNICRAGFLSLLNTEKYLEGY
jgi:hypothetical protein